MFGYYIYLISSLPMLHFGLKPPLSLEKFMRTCEGLLTEEDTEILKACTQDEIHAEKSDHPTINRYKQFDLALRNELAKVRASRKKVDAEKYLRQDGFTEPSISHLALNAHRNPSILEGERSLDLERWRFLEELTIGHYFDLDFLVVYAFKLMILEKWERVRGADRSQLMEQTLRG
jgi:hypothetical protein